MKKAKAPALYRNLLMVVIFLKTSLSLCSNSYAQNIPTRISNYKSSVNTNITSKTATSSITRTDVGNSYNDLADLVKVLYDTVKATASSNLQNVTNAGATTTNTITVNSGTNFSIVSPGVIKANSTATNETIQLSATGGAVHPALNFTSATKTGQLGARVTTNPVWVLPDTAGTLALKSNVGVYSVSGTAPIVAGALSGGTQAISLATSGVTAGTYGSATAIPVVTYDAYGRATTVSTVSATVNTVTGTSPIVAGAPSGGSQTISLATSGVTAGTYGSATAIPVVTYDAYGRATTVSTVSATGTTVTGTSPIVTGAPSGGTQLVSLATSGVTAGTYGSATAIPVVTYDAYGRATTVSTVSATGTTVTGTSPIVTGAPSGGTQVVSLATSGVTAGTYGSGSAIPVITYDAYGRATTVTTVSAAGGNLQSVTAAGNSTTLGLTATFPAEPGTSTDMYGNAIAVRYLPNNASVQLRCNLLGNSPVVLFYPPAAGGGAPMGITFSEYFGTGASRYQQLQAKDGRIAVVDSIFSANGSSNYTVPTATSFVKLATLSASRTITLPTAGFGLYPGVTVTLWNQNTSGTNLWSFASSVKDAANVAITNLTNSMVYKLEWTGTEWVKIN